MGRGSGVVLLERSSLFVDPALQPRIGGTDRGHVSALADNAEAWPPLAVVVREGQPWLVDGFHRLAAAEYLGLETVPAKVIEEPADGDLHALAFKLNAKHGRPLSTADRKAEALRLLELKAGRSSRSVGRVCGLNHETVERLRRDAVASGEIRQTETRVGDRAGGYEYRPRRPKGQLPDESAGQWLQGAAATVLGGRSAGAGRRAVSYLERVAVALEEQFSLSVSDAQELADAAGEHLSEERASALAQDLGVGALNLLRVARLLGFRNEGDS